MAKYQLRSPIDAIQYNNWDSIRQIEETFPGIEIEISKNGSIKLKRNYVLDSNWIVSPGEYIMRYEDRIIAYPKEEFEQEYVEVSQQTAIQ